jgi:hypothetical protein
VAARGEEARRQLVDIDQQEMRRQLQLEALERQRRAQAAGRARMQMRSHAGAARAAAADVPQAPASKPMPAWRLREQHRQEERVRRAAAGELSPVNRAPATQRAPEPTLAAQIMRRSLEDDLWATSVDQSEQGAHELEDAQQRDATWARQVDESERN